MADKTTPVSHASSYREVGEYWDQHDLADKWDETRDVNFDVDLQSSVTYFAVESSLAERLRSVARDQGVSAERLLNEWVHERVGGDVPSK
jgi:hypothetical protein